MAVTFVSHASTLSAQDVKVFLLAGQSNMYGKGEVSQLPLPWNLPQDDVWIWQDNLRDTQEWTSLRPGFGNRDSNFGSAGDNLRFDNPGDPHRFGPELTIGRTLADAFPDHRVAFIKHALGGTDVQSDWNPDWDPAMNGPYNNQDMYQGLFNKVLAATAELDRLKLGFEIAGVFWSQGGRDAKVLEKAQDYEQNLRHMFDSMRSDYNDPALPFILARQELSQPHSDLVRAAHEAIAASDARVELIDTDDIPDTSPTDAHWSTEGQLQVGVRFANEFLALTAANPEPLHGDYNGNGELDSGDLDLQAVAFVDQDSDFDLNSDGVIDDGDRQVWIHDLKKTWFGDTDLDGEFNTTDLVTAFRAGHYEDARDGNSTWSTGDWNGDTDFDTSDLVVAFQDAGFEKGPRAVIQVVPEPSGLVLVGVFVVLVTRLWRPA